MRIYLLALLVIISIPTAAFSFYKPSRIVAPEVFGMHCLKGSICVEDLATINIASDLVLTSVDEMQKDYSLVINAPRIVFCSTEKCTNRFGLGRRAAITIGTFGITRLTCSFGRLSVEKSRESDCNLYLFIGF